MTITTFSHVGILGAGAWGTALAQVCAGSGRAVTLWAREPEVADRINKDHENHLFLPGVTLASSITARSDLAELATCDLILAVPPAQHMRATLSALAAHIQPASPIILCAKGIEQGSLKLMTEVAEETLPGQPIAVLSGPSFAG
ncbi:MAG: hypothetical protein RIT46_1056, partial [Pseudomonadota bacterium]